MVYRFIIKLDNQQDLESIKNFFAKEEFKNKIIIKHFLYKEEADEIKGEYFLFYESEEFIFYDFLDNFDIKDLDENIQEVQELPKETISKLGENDLDVIYITNFPRKFNDSNIMELLSSFPGSQDDYKPKIERLPCVYKIYFNDSETCFDWIQSILLFCPNLYFSSLDSTMCAEINCLKVPVIHFIDLPPKITTIEYFIEVLKDDLGDFLLYEENDKKDNQPISFNISYRTEDEAWEIIDNLNLHPFEGKEIRVNHFIDTMYLQNMTKFNIKVTNYQGSMNSFDIYENFSKFGSIYSIYNKNPALETIQTMTNSNPQKDFFCIQYYEKESAEKAIKEAAKNLNMDGMILTMKDAGIVVYNFEKDVTEKTVKEVFPDAIKIVIKNSKDRNSRPYVFVNFTLQEECERAKEKCQKEYRQKLRLMCVPQTMSRDEAFLERKKEEERCQKKNTVFLSKIPDNCIAEDVIQACGEFGNIDSAVFIDIKNGKMRKRLAKISYSNDEEFLKANGKTIKLPGGRQVKLTKYIPHSH